LIATLKLHRQCRHSTIDERFHLNSSRIVVLVRRVGVVGRPATFVDLRRVGHESIEPGGNFVLPLLLAVVNV